MENQYFNQLSKISISNAFKIFDESFNNPKDIVYHYTSKEALYNIVENGSLRFTNILRLNDPLEIKFGIDVIKHITSDNQELNEFIHESLKFKEPNINPFFVFSTSENNDIHQQWINYGDRGNGVSIGFHRLNLFTNIKNKISNNSLCYIYPVIYYNQDFTLANCRMENFENNILVFLNKLNSDYFNATDKNDYLKEVYTLILVLASLIKSEFHKEELEWRYLVLTRKKDHIKTVLKNNEIQQVLEFIFQPILSYKRNDTFFKEIMLGPNQSNTEVSKLEISQYIRSSFIKGDDIKIVKSRGRIR